MSLIIGPTQWWQDSLIAQCPVRTSLLDGSRIICKAGGTAWIVAPSCTQVSSAWAGGQYNSTAVGDKCCICEWSGLETQLINCGFNPSDWFVPSLSQLQNPGFVCRTNWDSFSTAPYWSSSERNGVRAYNINYSNGCADCCWKAPPELCVRAFRCVTY